MSIETKIRSFTVKYFNKDGICEYTAKMGLKAPGLAVSDSPKEAKPVFVSKFKPWKVVPTEAHTVVVEYPTWDRRHSSFLLTREELDAIVK